MSDEPSADYWKALAEKRGEALNESLQECDKLREEVHTLKEENRICKEMLEESKHLVEVLQVCLCWLFHLFEFWRIITLLWRLKNYFTPFNFQKLFHSFDIWRIIQLLGILKLLYIYLYLQSVFFQILLEQFHCYIYSFNLVSILISIVLIECNYRKC